MVRVRGALRFPRITPPCGGCLDRDTPPPDSGCKVLIRLRLEVGGPPQNRLRKELKTQSRLRDPLSFSEFQNRRNRFIDSWKEASERFSASPHTSETQSLGIVRKFRSMLQGVARCSPALRGKPCWDHLGYNGLKQNRRRRLLALCLFPRCDMLLCRSFHSMLQSGRAGNRDCHRRLTARQSW